MKDRSMKMHSEIGQRNSHASARFPFLSPPVHPDEIGRLAQYRILRLIGKGGMSLVFAGEDVTLLRPVAIKVMKPDLEADASGWDRFLREARIMAAIKHESLVTVFQVGHEGDLVYMAMELLEGMTVEDRILRFGPATLPEILRIGGETAGGLTVIHNAGLVHRDLKPANLWLEKPTDRVKILDFGLARLMEDDTHLTKSGLIVGTPSFMSPEQAHGKPVNFRSDLFSLGCVLYALSAGENPFRGTNASSILLALVGDDPAPLQSLNPSIPDSLANLVDRLLMKDPARRPSSAEEVRCCLEQIANSIGNDSPAVYEPAEYELAESIEPCEFATGLPRTSVVPASTRKCSQPKTGLRLKWPVVFGIALVLFGLVTCFAAVVAVTAFGSGKNPSSRSTSGEVGRLEELSPPLLPAGPKVYLAEMEPRSTENWNIFPPPETGMPQKGIGEVRFNGRVMPNSLYMHPPPSFSGGTSATYRLNKKYRQFQTDVSMNDGPTSVYPSTCTIYGDAKVLWQSLPIRSQQEKQSCSVSVVGVEVLKIEVVNAGDPRCANIIWIDPHLTE